MCFYHVTFHFHWEWKRIIKMEGVWWRIERMVPILEIKENTVEDSVVIVFFLEGGSKGWEGWKELTDEQRGRLIGEAEEGCGPGGWRKIRWSREKRALALTIGEAVRWSDGVARSHPFTENGFCISIFSSTKLMVSQISHNHMIIAVVDQMLSIYRDLGYTFCYAFNTCPHPQIQIINVNSRFLDL